MERSKKGRLGRSRYASYASHSLSSIRELYNNTTGMFITYCYSGLEKDNMPSLWITLPVSVTLIDVYQRNAHAALSVLERQHAFILDTVPYYPQGT